MVEIASPKDVASVGGKAAGLLRLQSLGVRTPRWTVIEANVCREFFRHHGLCDRVSAALEGVTIENAAAVSESIQSWIVAAAPEQETTSLIASAYSHVGAGAVAVRSSAPEEDGHLHSFAGQFLTELNVSGLPAVIASVRRSWASAYSARSLIYRLLHKLTLRVTYLPVIVQTFVPATKSGVIFSVSPQQTDLGQVLISAAFGLGEGLVSGTVDADNYLLERCGRMLRSEIAPKPSRCSPARGGGCHIVPVRRRHQQSSVLSHRERIKLLDVALRVEAAFGEPQDIEWALVGRRLWILQSRPISASAASGSSASGGDSSRLRVWENANIVESFGGVTSPLTFSLAQYVYGAVFAEFYRLLGIPEQERHASRHWMRNMLGVFEGHVYYNLLSWCQMQRPLPFYELNLRMFESVIGAQKKIDTRLALAVPMFGGRGRGDGSMRWVRLRIAWRSLLLWLDMDRQVAQFLERFATAYQKFDRLPLPSLTAEQAYEAFLNLEDEIVPYFGRMLALDNTVGFTFGLLRLLIRRWLPAAPDQYLWQITRPASGSLVSVEPAEQMRRLALEVNENSDLRAVVESTEDSTTYERCRALGHSDFLVRVDDYLRRFGDRSVNELKLECPSMREQPEQFFILLRAAMRRPEGPKTAVSTGRSVSVETPFVDRYRELGVFRRFVFEWVRRKATRAVVAREEVRLCRTRAFGIIKRLTRAIGRGLAHQRLLQAPDDVFYLKLEELRGCFEGTIAPLELQPLVTLRKQHAAQYADTELPGRFDTQGLPYGGRVSTGLTDKHGAVASVSNELLHGTPSAAGVVEGAVRVVTAPENAGEGIVVAYRTDPGWVSVLPSASGLLIERGSPLTHLAIVARELGIPTIVQIPGLTRVLSTGMRVRMDGGEGTIRICH